MRWIRMKKTASGPDYTYQFPGTYEAPEWVALSLVQGGAAEFVGGAERVVETATAPEPETRQKRTEVDEPWTMKVTPEQYLERWPDGKYASLAKRLV
jgi:hypothetical protein